ncbi:hypothetical protein BDR26DRAFT_850272 [Obelidium mucronatum]|nr:hypothetical protein BDR26DRAFT_850272 [Obelidium mucronatum]
MANNELAARAKILTKKKLLKQNKATGAMPALPAHGSGCLPDCGDYERQQAVASRNCSSPLGGLNCLPNQSESGEELWDQLSKLKKHLWDILGELLGISTASIKLLHKKTTQFFCSSLLSHFEKRFLAIDPSKLNGGKSAALNLINNEGLTGPQLFLHNDFLTSATEFLKLSDTTWVLSMSSFLQTKSMYTLASLHVGYAIDLIAVNQRGLMFEGQSGRMYTDFLDVFNYDGRNRLYSTMAHRLQPNTENESERIKLRQ